MTGRRWYLIHGHQRTTVAELSLRLPLVAVRAVARVLANQLRAPVEIMSGSPSDARLKAHNPTLVHHGFAQRASWHLMSEHGAPFADLYFGNRAVARRVAHVIGNHYGAPLRLYSNEHAPTGTWIRAHRPQVAIRGRRNPKRIPVVGETWHGVMGDRCKILKVTKTTVTVLQLDTGHRVTSDINDFLASYRPPLTRNPGFVFGQPVPTTGLMASIRPGDRVTIVDRFGKHHTGRAVMPSAHGGWVLNMGGAHGTPGLADEGNTVRVQRGKRNPSPGGPVAMSQVRGRGWVQEWYDTASGDARIRALELRRLGFQVTSHAMGSQVTPLGRMRMTMVDIRGADDQLDTLPPVKVERFRNPARRITHRQALGMARKLVAHERQAARQHNPKPHVYATGQRFLLAMNATTYRGDGKKVALKAGDTGTVTLGNEAGDDTFYGALDRLPHLHPVPIGVRWVEPWPFPPGGPRRNPIRRGIDRRSIRTARTGVLVGCPTGHYHPRKHSRRKCDVGMRRAENPRRLPKYIAWVGSTSLAVGDTVEGVIEKAREIVQSPRWQQYTPGYPDIRVTTYARQSAVQAAVSSSPYPTASAAALAAGRRLYREVTGQTENPRAPLAHGERVSVPYSGRASYFGRKTTRTREHAIVEGMDPEGTVHVRVQRGQSAEEHHFPPSAVRRLPSSRAKPVQRLKERIELKALRERRRQTLAAAERARKEYECADAKAHALYPVAGEAPSPEYRRLRSQMLKLEREMAAQTQIAGELERSDPSYRDPFAINPRRGCPLERARRTLRMWQDRDVRGRFRKLHGPPRVIPRTLVKLGDVVNIDYRSNKYTGRPVTYTHRFKRPRPVLVTDPDAQHVYLVGGRTKVTADGLVN